MHIKLLNALVKLLIQFTGKIPFTSLAFEVVFALSFDLLLSEKNVGINLLNRILFVIFDKSLRSNMSSISVVD